MFPVVIGLAVAGLAFVALSSPVQKKEEQDGATRVASSPERTKEPGGTPVDGAGQVRTGESAISPTQNQARVETPGTGMQFVGTLATPAPQPAGEPAPVAALAPAPPSPSPTYTKSYTSKLAADATKSWAPDLFF